MFLEYWMIFALFVLFAWAMHDMYKFGYRRAYVEGGIYAHVMTMTVLQNVLTKEELERVSNAIIEKGGFSE